MAKRKEKEEIEELSGGTYIFQEVSKVKIQPGLGVFVDPHPDLSPDDEGKIPIHVRGSESFEMMRFRATKAKVDQFIQENKADLKESGVSPESLEISSMISAGFYTEKALREFMGEGSEDDQSYAPWSARADAENDDWEGKVWEIGKGWVTKEKEKPATGSAWSRWSTGGSYGSSGWDDDYSGAGYYGGGYRGYTPPKPKRYRTLQTMLEPMNKAIKAEMWENAMRVLENPSDVARVAAVKVLEKIDVLELKDLSEWEVRGIVSSIVGDIKWDVGYHLSGTKLMEAVEGLVGQIVQLIAKGVPKLLREAESPERLMVDFSVLVDVDTDEPKKALGGLFARLEAAQEEAEEAAAKKGSGSGEEIKDGELEIFGENDEPHEISYTYEPAIWGKLRIIEHPLTPSNELRRKTVTYRPTDVGAHLGDISRILTDERIFKEMRPTPSGSLLVDCSSSMGMTAKDVHLVLQKVPGAVIGLYSGNGGSGVLHIVARAGKVAANIDAIISAALRMGGNVVDGPSLDWLVTQPKPRIWYSDGGVTGLKDSPGLNLRDVANNIMRMGRVGRIVNQKKLPAAFLHMRKETTVGRAKIR